MRAVHLLSLLLPVVLSYERRLNPLSNEFIDLINSKQSTWVAGKNFDDNISIEAIKKLLGAKLTNLRSITIEEFIHPEDIQVPESFDAREYFKECTDVISTIADQSGCGSCWAVSVASAMTDRRCIASNGKLKIPVSAEDLMSCCHKCGDGCDGGDPKLAWSYWCSSGISTGGAYNSSQGCKPYSMVSCGLQCSSFCYKTPECKKQCVDPKLNYTAELTYGNTTYKYSSVKNIQREILTNGAVVAGFDVYEDFLICYKSGIYQYVAGKKVGHHAVRIIGWGETDGIPYWLVANSWSEYWGIKGLFKIRRGNNEVGVESNVYAAVPKL